MLTMIYPHNLQLDYEDRVLKLYQAKGEDGMGFGGKIKP